MMDKYSQVTVLNPYYSSTFLGPIPGGPTLLPLTPHLSPTIPPSFVGECPSQSFHPFSVTPPPVTPHHESRPRRVFRVRPHLD